MRKLSTRTLFIAYVALSIIIVFPSLFGWLLSPFDISIRQSNFFLEENSQTSPKFIVFAIGAFVSIYLMLYALYEMINERRTGSSAWVGMAVSVFIFLAGVPDATLDTYTYFEGGYRELHGMDIFAPNVSDPTRNELFRNAQQQRPTYGPLAQKVMMAVVFAAERFPFSEIKASLVVWKIFNLLLFAAAFALFTSLGKALFPKDPAGPALFFFLNPLVLYQLAMQGHNDMFVCLPLLLALWFAGRGRWKSVVVTLAVGFCLKMLPIMYLPLFVAFSIAKQSGRGAWRPLLGYSLLFIAVSAFLHLPYAIDFDESGLVINPITKAIPGLHMVSHQVFWNSLALFIRVLAQSDDSSSIPLLLFLIGYGLLMRHLWRNRSVITLERLAAYCFGATVLYLATASPNIMPWYFPWLIVFAALLDIPAVRSFIAYCCCPVFLLYQVNRTLFLNQSTSDLHLFMLLSALVYLLFAFAVVRLIRSYRAISSRL